MLETNKKITYILGAGASFYAVPTVEEMKKIDRVLFYSGTINEVLLELFEQDLPLQLEDISDLYNKFIAEVDDVLREISGTFSFDTLAKFAFLKGDEIEYERIKFFLQEVFLYWHLVTPCSVQKSRSEDYNSKQKIDPRYEAFLATICKRDGEGLVFPSNINIISYNYDYQIEETLKSLLQNNEELEEVINLLPTQKPEKNGIPSLIKVNSSISSRIQINKDDNQFINESRMTEYDNIGRDDKKKNKYIIETLKRYYSFCEFKKDSINGVDNTSYKRSGIKFSWDEFEPTQQAKQKAIEIVRESDEIVVIGYSFPTFNKEFDYQMVSAIRQGTKVTVQDLTSKPILDRLRQMRGNSSFILEAIDDCKEFYIPNSFFFDTQRNMFGAFTV